MIELSKVAGLYIVTLNNLEPISVNAGDPRIADRCIKVNRANCKFGKTRDFAGRKRNYFKHFGEENVNFFPLAALQDVAVAESAILSRLHGFCMFGRTGRRNEWLAGIQPAVVEQIVFERLDELGIKYQRLGSVQQT